MVYGVFCRCSDGRSKKVQECVRVLCVVEDRRSFGILVAGEEG